MRLMAFVVALAMVLSLPVVPGVKAAGEEVILWVSGLEPVSPGECAIFTASLDWPDDYYEEVGYDVDPPEDAPETESGEIIPTVVFEPVEDVTALEKFGIYVDHYKTFEEEDHEPGQAAYISKDAQPGEYKIGTFKYTGKAYTCAEPEIDAVVCVQGETGTMIKPYEDSDKGLSMQLLMYADGYTADVIDLAVDDKLQNTSAKSAIQSALSGTGTLIAAYDFSITAIGNEEDENDFDKDLSAVVLELADSSYTSVTWYKLDPDTGYAIEQEYPIAKKSETFEGDLGGFGTYAIVGTKSSVPEPEPEIEYEYSSLEIGTIGEGSVTVKDKKTGKTVAESDYDKLDPKGTYVLKATAADDYKFVMWTDNVGVSLGMFKTKAEIEITDLAEEVSVKAQFVEEKPIDIDDPEEDPDTCELVIETSEGGSVKVECGGEVLSGSDLKALDPEDVYYLTAEADEEDGYEFAGWVQIEGDFETAADLETEPVIQINGLDKKVVIKAVFKQKDKTYYSLTIDEVEGVEIKLSDSEGKTVAGTELGKLDPDETYSITASTDETHMFIEWILSDGIETDDSLGSTTISFKITADGEEISVEAEEIEAALSSLSAVADPAEGGTVVVYDIDGDEISKRDYGLLNSDSEYRLVATAKDGYKFMVWAVDGAILKECSANDSEITIGDLGLEVSVKAVFVKDLIDISDAKVKLQATYVYTGKAITPDVTVTLDGKTLKKDVDYELKYSDNKKVGTAKVTVIGTGEYTGSVETTFAIKRAVLKYRAYVQKQNWQKFGVAPTTAGTDTAVKAPVAGTEQDLRMETIQMQLKGVGGYVRYRAYCDKLAWTQWASTEDTTTYAGTKGQSRRVEMIQLQAKGEIATLYDFYYRAYSWKFGWLGWAGNNEKAGSAGYASKLCAFQVRLVPKGTKFDKGKMKSFYDVSKDGKNPPTNK